MKGYVTEAFKYRNLAIFVDHNNVSNFFDHALLAAMASEARTEVWCGSREKICGVASFRAARETLAAGVAHRTGLHNMDEIVFDGNVFLPQAEAWPATVTRIVTGSNVKGRRVWRTGYPADILEAHPDMMARTDGIVIVAEKMTIGDKEELAKSAAFRAAVGADVVEDLLTKHYALYVVPNRAASSLTA